MPVRIVEIKKTMSRKLKKKKLLGKTTAFIVFDFNFIESQFYGNTIVLIYNFMEIVSHFPKSHFLMLYSVF